MRNLLEYKPENSYRTEWS